MKISRRLFLKGCFGTGLLWGLTSRGLSESDSRTFRRYNVSISIEALERNPELIRIFATAGISEVWLCGFLYGHWYFTPEIINKWKGEIEREGLKVSVINVPLGHPGDSLGSYSGNVPLTPPLHWSLAIDHTGRKFAGTSLHTPACEENKDAIRKITSLGIDKIFLDDDFRLAQAPGQIGGCYCDTHKRDFLKKYGYTERDWDELIYSVTNRKFTRILKDWIDHNCDLLTECFHKLENSVGTLKLGIMVMYMGSEKAGIRLEDYKGKMFRVGEGMFDDTSFGTVKGKCNELFSVLFHRRFVAPEDAYSETTAFPADKLSAKNMCAKLVISTIADVRNTMFMSGLQHFPETHWELLPQYMRKQAQIHQKVAGMRLKGPFKLYWGRRSRYISDDNPFSLFLAMGIPFEVVDEPKNDGWTFISEYDLDDVKDELSSRCVSRTRHKNIEFVPEELSALFDYKQRIKDDIKGIPHIVEDKPAVCAWYPDIKKVLVWNLSEHNEKLTLRKDEKTLNFSLSGLDSILLDDMG